MDSDHPLPTTPKSPSSASGSFGYQARLLERTSSTRSNNTLSRNTSLSTRGILPVTQNVTGTRKWAPAHKGSASVDGTRGKWEERIKAEAVLNEDQRTRSPSPTKSTGYRSQSPTLSRHDSRAIPEYRPSTPPSYHRSAQDLDTTPTPRALKRQTMPSPIIASPLSPNTTGISVEATSPSEIFATPQRIHLPQSSTSFPASHAASSDLHNRYSPSPPSRYRRPTLDSVTDNGTAAVEASPSPLRRRPLSTSYGSSSSSAETFSTPSYQRPAAPPSVSVSAPVPPEPSSSVMSPPADRKSVV